MASDCHRGRRHDRREPGRARCDGRLLTALRVLAADGDVVMALREVDRAAAQQAALEKIMLQAGGIAGEGSIGSPSPRSGEEVPA